MREYGLTILVAAAVTYLLTPLVRRFAIAVGAEHAARARDVHTEPVPLLGGLAMYLGLAAALLVASRLSHLSTVFMGSRVASGLLLAGGVVVVLGFVDDRWGLGAITKMAGQVAAGVILVWSGAVVAWLPVPGGGTLSLTSDQQTVLTILVVVVTINAVNFIDGLDGLAAGIVGIGAAAFFLYYYTLTKRLGLDDQTGPALAAAILAGVCLGFLPHNFHPARIFMGDTGSMLLGLLLAYVPISSLASLDPNTLTNPSAYSGGTVNRFPEILPLLVPAIIMLIPYADLLLAVVRRTRAGQSPFSADKKHLQHRLLAIGHSHRGSVLIMYLWAVLFAGTVVLLSIIRTKLLVLGLVTLAGVLILLLASMPRLRPWNRRGQLRLSPNIAGPVPPGAPVPAGAGAAVVPGGPAPSGGPPSGGPVSSGLLSSGGPGGPGHSIPPQVPAAAGTAARGRRRADRGASPDRGLPVDRGLGVDRGLSVDREAGVDRAASVRPQRRWDLGYEDPLRGDAGRGDVAYGDPLRGDAARENPAYEDPLRQDAGYGDPLRGDAAYGNSRPGGRAGTGWDARPAGTPWDGRPAEPARPADPAARDSRPASAAWVARSAAIPPEMPAPAEAVPGPGSPVAPTDGGWAPDQVGGRDSGQWYPGRTDPARTDLGRQDSGRTDPGRTDPGLTGSARTDPGLTDSGRTDPGLTGSGHQDPGLTGSGWTDPARQDSAQWYSGRPEPSQWDSGGWDSRPYDAGSRDAGLQGTGLEDAGLPGPGLRDPGPRDPGLRDPGPRDPRPQNAARQDARPQDIDPLTPDPARSQPPRPAQARPVHPDANEDSEEEESPLLPWRFH
jgi:UDP-GlcNAc:undecaprenyl-phosphate/decaprenyl-phosphate GlcNAc-1-phosphate transferase